ncbi:MAG: hypothetical protein GF307_11265 [candidate division Zixibacteria bacterium]|nr:hypothetical protein [candidate division Zixibacteria bacterium]
MAFKGSVLNSVLKIIVGIVLGTIILNTNSKAIEKPDRAWRYPGYDLLDSRVYPYASKPVENLGFKLSSVSLLYGENFHYILSGDLDSDGNMEICISDKQSVSIYDPNLEIIRRIDTPYGSCIISLLEDMNANGDLEIGIGYSKDRQVSIAFYGINGNLVNRYQEEVYKQSSLATLCRTGDNLISFVNSGYSRYPRGVMIHDCNTGDLDCLYGIGPIVTGLSYGSIADINNDGDYEISIFNASSENGSFGLGSSRGGTITYDDCTYTIVVNEHGQECFTVKESSKSNDHQYSKFVKFREDSSFTLLCYNKPHNHCRPMSTSRLILRDVVTGNRKKIFYGATGYYMDCIACDLDANGIKEIIVSNYDDVIQIKREFFVLNYILDNNLNVSRYSRDISGIINCANDINGDGYKELIFKSDFELLITDYKLNELWNHRFEKPIFSNIIILDADLDGYNEIYLATQSDLYRLSAEDTPK